MRVHTVTQLSPRQELTPAGYLLCRDVPIGRTGRMIYGAYQTPVAPGSDGLVYITRDAEEVFRDESVSSYAGAPVVITHPDDAVDPTNWRSVTVGTVLNPRRGTGRDADLLMADLLIQDAEAIAFVQKNKPEVSCGYDAEYVQDAPGLGRQKNIIGNHVALVDKGRCGSRCAIGDEIDMTTPPAVAAPTAAPVLDAEDAGLLARLRAAFTPKPTADCGNAGAPTMDAAAFATAVGVAVAKALEPVNAKLDALTPKAAAPAAAADVATVTADAAAITAAFADFRTRAEILSPGFVAPTVAATDDAATATERLNGARRRILQAVSTADEGMAAIKPFLGGQPADFAKLPQATIDSAFVGASELIRVRNNAATADALNNPGGPKAWGTRATIDKVQTQNTEFWATRNPT